MIVHFFTDGDTPEEVEEWAREVDSSFVLSVELGRVPSIIYVRGPEERRYRCWRVEWRDSSTDGLATVEPWVHVEPEEDE